MGERAARELLRSTAESLCVRYLHDATGQIWFGSERELVPTTGLNRRKRGLATAALVAATPLLSEACGGADPYAPSPYAVPLYGDDAGVGQDQETEAGTAPSLLIDAGPHSQTDAAAPDGEGGTSGDPDAGEGGNR